MKGRIMQRILETWVGIKSPFFIDDIFDCNNLLEITVMRTEVRSNNIIISTGKYCEKSH